VVGIGIINGAVFDLLRGFSIGLYLLDNEGSIIFKNDLAAEYDIEPEIQNLLAGEGTEEVLSGDGKVIFICNKLTLGTYNAIVVIPIDKAVYSRFMDALATYQETDTIINNIYDEIFVTDAKGTVISVNRACERLYNKTAAEIIGRNVKDLEKEGFFSPSITELVVKTKKRALGPFTLFTNQSSGCFFSELTYFLIFRNAVGWLMPNTSATRYEFLYFW
jgi:PAS domain-containing protein